MPPFKDNASFIIGGHPRGGSMANSFRGKIARSPAAKGLAFSELHPLPVKENVGFLVRPLGEVPCVLV